MWCEEVIRGTGYGDGGGAYKRSSVDCGIQAIHAATRDGLCLGYRPVGWHAHNRRNPAKRVLDTLLDLWPGRCDISQLGFRVQMNGEPLQQAENERD